MIDMMHLAGSANQSPRANNLQPVPREIRKDKTVKMTEVWCRTAEIYCRKGAYPDVRFDLVPHSKDQEWKATSEAILRQQKCEGDMCTSSVPHS